MDTPSVSPQEVTNLLTRWSHGDDAALAELTPLVYDELRRIAHRHMGGQRPDHTLQTTALVNEAYLRLADLCILDHYRKTIPPNATIPRTQHEAEASARSIRCGGTRSRNFIPRVIAREPFVIMARVPTSHG